LLSLDPHVSVEAVEEAADTVVSEDKVRCKGDNRGGGGGVGGGEMLERLELTAESLSLSSSTEWCPGVGALLPVDNLYSKLRSDLGTGQQHQVNNLVPHNNNNNNNNSVTFFAVVACL